MDHQEFLANGETLCYGLVKEKKDPEVPEKTVSFGNRVYSILLTCPTGDLSEFINDNHPGWEITKLAHSIKHSSFRILEICSPKS